MGTSHPLEGYFGSAFPAICYHRGVVAAWSRKTLNILSRFVLGKRPITVKCSKFCFATPIDVLRLIFVKFDRREIGEIVRCLPDKKSHGCPVDATTRISPKICQSQPPTMYSESECSRFHPNRFTFGAVIVERVNTTKTRHKMNPVFGRIMICNPQNR